MIVYNLRKPNLCSATILETKLFHYDKEENSFSQEISSLPIRDIDQLKQRIFYDACDIGFWLRSERTRNLMLFTFEKPDVNNDGDVMGWNFKSEEGITLLVIND
jgi:hypothetical protein